MFRLIYPKRRTDGFTMIELLVVVAIIGIIAAMLIPNLLDALAKAKQKRSMASVRNLGTQVMSRITDGFGAASAGQDAIFTWPSAGAGCISTCDELFTDAESKHCRDGWNSRLELLAILVPGSCPDLEDEGRLVAVRSCGSDLACDGSYAYGSFGTRDYTSDIVWVDGFFIRWPEDQGQLPAQATN
jgi:prepilin-type N-terminal cleavage/methylation domain-containing protein